MSAAGSPPLNEWACRVCRAPIVAAFPICEQCAARVRRLNTARELLAQADAARREHPFPPARQPWRWGAR